MTAVIESDIPAVEKKIEYETLLKAKRLLAIIAASLPYIPNVSNLAGLMGTNRNQLLKLFNLLDRAGLIRQLFSGTQNPNSLAKPQKILLNNSSLMHALENPQIGAARESTFASECQPQGGICQRRRLHGRWPVYIRDRRQWKGLRTDPEYPRQFRGCRRNRIRVPKQNPPLDLRLPLLTNINSPRRHPQSS